MRKNKHWRLVTILFPVLLLLGIVAVVTIPKGSLLKASPPEAQLVDLSKKGEAATGPIETAEESVEFEVKAKEDGMYQILYETDKLPVTFVAQDNALPYYEVTSTEFQLKGDILTFNRASSTEEQTETTKPSGTNEAGKATSATSSDTAKDTQSSEKEKIVEEHTESGVYKVIDSKEPVKGIFYLKLKAGETVVLRADNCHVKEQTVLIKDAKNSELQQTLIRFKEAAEPEVTSESKGSDSAKESSTKEIASSESKSSEQSAESTEESSEPVDKEDAQQSDEKPLDIGKETENADTKESVEDEQDGVPENNPEEFENILSVATLPTSKSLKELTDANYQAEKSLKAPLYLGPESGSKASKTKTSPISIKKVHLSVKTGTASFDADNTRGHDSSDTNTIVRSFDQISYLVSFSIQNDVSLKEYKNIRYRVIATLPNAVEIDNGVPKSNGEIANGTNSDYEVGDGSQYSQGVMESTISDTGQVFVPVILNVYGADHGKAIQPILKLEIVDAVNSKTGETEAFNELYDKTDFPKLEAPVTTVSSIPSLGVELVQGATKTNTVFNSSNTNIEAYDVGAVTTLQPLAGRASGDYRGSAFPKGPITYNVKQKGTYQIGGNPAQNLTTAQFDSFNLKAYAPAINDRSQADWKKTGVVNTQEFTDALGMPNSKTEKIYNSQPVGDLTKIGVYDSGEFTKTDNSYSTTITNKNYAGIYNPYTFNMTGERTYNAMTKSFSSLEMIFSWDRTKTANLASKNGWTRYDITLYVDSISYDGLTSSNDSRITYPMLNSPLGNYWTSPTIGVPSAQGYLVDGVSYAPATQGINNISSNYGNAQISMGQKVMFTDYAFSPNYTDIKGSEHIVMWDPTGFKYDNERKLAVTAGPHLRNASYKIYYGVAKNLSTSPPYTMKIGTLEKMKPQYNWYETPEAAQQVGDISAVNLIYNHFDVDVSIYNHVQTSPWVPTIVTSQPGDRTPAGNPITVLAAHKFMDAKGNTKVESPNWWAPDESGHLDSNGIGTYKPTIFDNKGNPTSYPMKYWNYVGETAYVRKMAISTKTDVEKELYQTTDEINIKVNGVLTGDKTVDYDGALNTTLPKGIHYVPGSSKDAYGADLPEPTVVTNGDGTTILRWTFQKIPRETGIEVNFKATTDFTQLKFKESGYTDSLNVKTVGELWVSGNPAISDKSEEKFRSSLDQFIEQLIQQIILSKSGDKPAIEVGEKDPVGVDNKLKYTIKMDNESASPIVSPKILDVLPYDGDSRGTKFSGTYTVENLKLSDPAAKIEFTTQSVNETTDPNTITGWTTYVPGTTSLAAIKNAKAFLVSKSSMASGETIKLEVTIKPMNQKAGDILVNNAHMNSGLNLPVHSQTVWTNVYGRTLKGLAWYDDNLNGLKDGGEEITPNIPVKLYRTSQVNTSYKNELVKENLTGQKFIDASGNSLVKTDASGNYQFTNLPEGDYVAYFEIGSEVTAKKFKVTKKDAAASSQAVGTSKVDLTTYKTDKYNTPTLDGGNFPDNEWKVENINLGLVRPGKIRLFKYSEGTAIDADKNGKLSDAEKATGTPLAGAVFDIYKGDQEEKIGTATTKSDGTIEFDKLFPGDYTLVETKAPSGHELLKKPIKVTVTQGNQLIPLYLADNQKSDLPFTGGQGLFGLLLMIAGGVTTLGFVGILVYYRPRKTKGGR